MVNTIHDEKIYKFARLSHHLGIYAAEVRTNDKELVLAYDDGLSHVTFSYDKDDLNEGNGDFCAYAKYLMCQLGMDFDIHYHKTYGVYINYRVNEWNMGGKTHTNESTALFFTLMEIAEEIAKEKVKQNVE